MTVANIEGFGSRLAATYSAAVADVLDGLGLTNFAIESAFLSVISGITIAGPAFTIRGRPIYGEGASDPRYKQIDMLEAVYPGSLLVYDGGGYTGCAHWGGMMARAAKESGAVGALIDGGLRDVRQIKEVDFPTFGRFVSPYTAVDRFEITEFETPLVFGGVTISPGDFIVADEDGAVRIPKDIIQDVVEKVESIAKAEEIVLGKLADGGVLRELFAEYGVL